MQEIISILCPTRKRPEYIVRLYDSICETVDNPELVEIIFGMDADDAEGLKAVKTLKKDVKIKMEVGNRRPDLSAYYNTLLWVAGPEHIYMIGADDIIFKTPGWDKRVRETYEKFPDRIALVWGKDRHPAPNQLDCATHPFIHWNWAVAVGYLIPPAFSRCIDVWMLQIAVAIDRFVYLEDVVIHHPTYAQRGKIDETLRELDQRLARDNFQFNARKGEQAGDTTKLKQFIKAIKLARQADLKKIKSLTSVEEVVQFMDNHKL